ncbi:MAG TPA: hypothetical protein VG838_03330 [Opitutaceae bacterium]|nr:hypothetical protein [Opitutaceae bacterium]
MAKAHKIEKPANRFRSDSKVSNQAAAQQIMRVARLTEVRETNAQLMQTHREELQKLAQ